VWAWVPQLLTRAAAAAAAAAGGGVCAALPKEVHLECSNKQTGRRLCGLIPCCHLGGARRGGAGVCERFMCAVVA
jgi:hypothetical protein